MRYTSCNLSSSFCHMLGETVVEVEPEQRAKQLIKQFEWTVELKVHGGSGI